MFRKKLYKCCRLESRFDERQLYFLRFEASKAFLCGFLLVWKKPLCSFSSFCAEDAFFAA